MKQEATGSSVVNTRLLWLARILNGAFLLACLFFIIVILSFTNGSWLSAVFVACLFGFIQWGLWKNPATKSALALAIGACSLLLALEAMALINEVRSMLSLLALWGIAVMATTYLTASIKLYYSDHRGPHDKRTLTLGVLCAWIIISFSAIVFADSVFARDSRVGTNEYSAVSSLRAIHVAESTYSSEHPGVGFACRLKELGGAGSDVPSSTSAALIDEVLADGVKSGYRFTIFDCGDHALPHRTYQVSAEPMQVGITGRRSFCSDQSGVIRYSRVGTRGDCLLTGIPIE
jgi:hypothetical protein